MSETTLQQVEKYRHDLEVIRVTAALVIKDFAGSGISITFSGNENLAYAELKEQVLSAIRSMRKHPETLQSLLYRIDVDEKRLSEPAGVDTLEDERLCDLILERELTKAVFRKIFKPGGGSAAL